MPTCSSAMTDQGASPKQPKVFIAFWVVLILIVAVGVSLLVPARTGPVIDKARHIDLEAAQIHAALQSYEATFGAFPVGDSSAVFRALRGQNPRQIVFLSCRSESVSSDGGFLDPWGTPYKVYFSGGEVLIRSAGPNKQFDDSSDKHFDDYIR